MVEPILNIPFSKDSPQETLSKEWLVTNGLGGYASGTILGINTRRYHGLFIPNLPSPRGRNMMIPCLDEYITTSNQTICLGGHEFNNGTLQTSILPHLKEFRLDWQTPIWVFEIDGCSLEKKIFMPYGNNTVYVSYRLLKGDSVELKLRPYCNCRKHDSPLGYAHRWPFSVTFQGERYEISPFEGAPLIRVTLKPFKGSFTAEPDVAKGVYYRIEAARGLDCVEDIYSPGFFSFKLNVNESVCFIASTESWEAIEEDAVSAFDKEMNRRKRLLATSLQTQDDLVTAQLTLAADQFIILPRSRNEKNSLLESLHERVRTVIAGYHWFTDWGRDTMISLEGLTLCTGRNEEAKAILLTFGHYVKNGLLPNHFPEGQKEAIYNTVDATFWYFHAIDRYFQLTQDQEILELLYPTLQSIVEHHIKGTEFGIHMDIFDSLISSSAEGFQLTWMDAKVDEWVVTPRRGKPVEIQALWFNALKLMELWSKILGKPPEFYGSLAQKVFESFNTRFWCEKEGHLYDVIDMPASKGNDSSLRPNQIFAVSLRFPVLRKELWKSIVDIVEERLLTPYGLRSLDPKDRRYHAHYEGNRWNRDAAYHQGLVWTWLIGPFLDAWNKVYNDPPKAQEFFKALEVHLKEEGVGTISEIFDAEAPFHPRGCIAQAWSVAEVLRCFLVLRDKKI
jgi:predicted glycogen debranching enzyme